MTENCRVSDQKIYIVAGDQKSKILVRHIFFEHFRIFFWPCLGPLAARLRPSLVGTWLVEWLHRRVIASAGAIRQRKVAMWSVRLRHSDRFFDVEMDRSQKFLLIRLQHFYRRTFSESISFRRCKIKKLYRAKQRVPWLEIFDYLIEKSAFSLELKNRKFCLDMSFPSTSVYFCSALPGAARCALAPHLW